MSLRADRLREGATLLSKDFGFREAVATRDAATIVSATENLKRRFAIDRVFIVGVDGKITGGDTADMTGDAHRLLDAFNNADDPSGVVLIAGKPYQVMAAPVLSPDQIGWLVFAVRLDRTEMTALEKLSAIPLAASVVHRDRGGWRLDGVSEPDRQRLSSFVDRVLKSKKLSPQTLNERGGESLALVKPLPVLTTDTPTVLVLRYPLALALAPYRIQLAVVVLAGLAGLAVVGWGSWALARGITKPIIELDAAAHQLQAGEDSHVEIDSEDEIGRLAGSFNTMATAIRDRERRITHLAMHDGETGLPNRLALERVMEALSDLPEGQVYVAALVCSGSITCAAPSAMRWRPRRCG